MSVCQSVLSVTFVHCGQTVGLIKMKLGVRVGLGPGHIVLDGDPAPHPAKGHSPPPKFSAHVYCGQTAVWIKMPLDMEEGLGVRDTVFECVRCGPSYPRKKAHPLPPNFWPMSVVAKWLDG